MVTIKKDGKELRIPNSHFVTSQDVSDGLYLVCRDKTEIRIMNDDRNRIPQYLTAAKVLQGAAPDQDIVIDLDSMTHAVSITNPPPSVPKNSSVTGAR